MSVLHEWSVHAGLSLVSFPSLIPFHNLSILASLGISSGCSIARAYLGRLGCEILKDVSQQLSTCVR